MEIMLRQYLSGTKRSKFDREKKNHKRDRYSHKG